MNMYEYKKSKVSDLIPYANNSKVHSEEQIDQIAASIKEFGFTNPVLIDENNELIAGHGRVMAAQKLNIKEVPSVVLSGLTESQKKAYIISDNKIAENSTWNTEVLKSEIEDIFTSDNSFDMGVLAFNEKELSKIFDETGGISLDDALIKADLDYVTVKFMPRDRNEVLNSLNESVSEIAGVEIWCDDEQV